MNPLLITGVCFVVLALSSYTAAIVSQLRTKRFTTAMRTFLSAGVALDATATIFMIAGSRRIPLTFHGVWGYTALLGMAIDLVLMWRRYRGHPDDVLPARLHRYSLAAYVWWDLAFLAGMTVAMAMK